MRKPLSGAWNASISIVISTTRIALYRESGWPRRQSATLAQRHWPHEDFADAQRLAPKLRDMLAESGCERMPVRIILSDAMARMWMVTPPQNAASLADCRAAVMLRFQALYGEPAHGWEIAADIDARHPFVACALPDTLLAALVGIARERHLTVLEIVPQFLGSWNRSRARIGHEAWFGVLHEDTLSIGAISRRRLCAVRSTRLPDDAGQDRGWLAQHLKREALRLELSMPARIDLCGPVPAPWLQSTDGLRCTRLGGMEQQK